MEPINDSESFTSKQKDSSLQDVEVSNKKKGKRLKRLTEELIASVLCSDVALARLSGPIQKR